MPLDLDRICIEPLNDLHQRGAFCCKDPGIQNFCRGQIADHNRRKMIKAYVASDQDSRDVLGFYYLLNTSVEHDQLGPEGYGAQFIGLDKIPAVYLGMIGVHQPLEKQGVGTLLMIHALQRTLEVAELTGVWALTLDAIDDCAVAYYKRFDFKPFVLNSREMYLPLGTIRSVFEEMGLDHT